MYKTQDDKNSFTYYLPSIKIDNLLTLNVKQQKMNLQFEAPTHY